jgi:hypothetical protein
MDKFKASFRFYEQGAPYPGMCLRCSAGSKLWDLGRNIPGTNMAAYYCDNCLIELASFTGLVNKSTYEEKIKEANEALANAKAQLDAAPQLIKELTHNVSSLLGEFVTSLASISGSNKPVQPEGNKANSGNSDASTEEPGESVKGSAKTSKPSAKSAKQ